MKRQHLDAEFLQRLEKIKHHLVPLDDLPAYFTQDKINGFAISTENIGCLNINAGQIAASNIFSFANHEQILPFYEVVPKGKAQVTLSLIEIEGHKYVAALMLSFAHAKAEDAQNVLTYQDKEPLAIQDFSHLKLYNALQGDENLFTHFSNSSVGSVYFGFDASAGQALIGDRQSQKYLSQLIAKKREENKNFDFVKDLIEAQLPQDQNNSEHYGLIKLSDEYNMLFVETGLGEGEYPGYFAFNEQDEIECLIFHFIDIKHEPILQNMQR